MSAALSFCQGFNEEGCCEGVAVPPISEPSLSLVSFLGSMSVCLVYLLAWRSVLCRRLLIRFAAANVMHVTRSPATAVHTDLWSDFADAF